MKSASYCAREDPEVTTFGASEMSCCALRRRPRNSSGRTGCSRPPRGFRVENAGGSTSSPATLAMAADGVKRVADAAAVPCRNRRLDEFEGKPARSLYMTARGLSGHGTVCQEEQALISFLRPEKRLAQFSRYSILTA